MVIISVGIIFMILLIFQMVVLATAIDVGSAAILRDFTTTNATRTYIEKNNPANLSGKITSVELRVAVQMLNCEVATFFVVSGNNLSTRDSAALGTVNIGYQSFSGLDITVEAGDYIGIYYSSGGVSRTDSGDGYWWIDSDQIPCTNQAFTLQADRTLSIYGTGATVEVAKKKNVIFMGSNF